jgi:hypothetical protein
MFKPILASMTELVSPSIEYATLSTVPCANPLVWEDMIEDGGNAKRKVKLFQYGDEQVDRRGLWGTMGCRTCVRSLKDYKAVACSFRNHPITCDTVLRLPHNPSDQDMMVKEHDPSTYQALLEGARAAIRFVGTARSFVPDHQSVEARWYQTVISTSNKCLPCSEAALSSPVGGPSRGIGAIEAEGLVSILVHLTVPKACNTNPTKH